MLRGWSSDGDRVGTTGGVVRLDGPANLADKGNKVHVSMGEEVVVLAEADEHATSDGPPKLRSFLVVDLRRLEKGGDEERKLDHGEKRR